MEYLFKGLLIGLIFGVPAGVIGALTIKRTLEQGFKAGLVTGMGSSAADVLYAGVGVFGITTISDFLENYQRIIGFAGGILIIFMGLSVWKKKVKRKFNLTKGRSCICIFYHPLQLILQILQQCYPFWQRLLYLG